ncbi:MAG: YgfZ/GcvT domain-containing protein [Burkholderiales bacterium]
MISITANRSELRLARLRRYGVLSVTGEDARGFLHAQLTNDIEHLPADQARIAGWCSAKGRLLASFIVLPQPDGFLLQLAADLAPAVAKRLGMFVLRTKVKIFDVGQRYTQLGVWGTHAIARLAELGVALGQSPMAVANVGELTAVRVDLDRVLIVARSAQVERIEAGLGTAMSEEDEWTLLDIRAGRALIEQATQDLFVPQMINLEAVGGVDFKKGCYPGQEIVARAQYRGQIKRRMIRARLDAHVDARPGSDLYSDGLPGQASGTVVSVAAADGGRELLAVVPIASVEQGAAIRLVPAGPAIEVLSLPYAN